MSSTLTFQNDDGIPLAARLDLPPDGDPIACALFAHCFTCSKNLSAVGNISRALTQEGIAVLRFDFTGLGESEGEFADTNFSSNVSDLLAAARFMEQEVEAPSILVGHSLGGAAVLQAAAHLDSVQAVATIGAPYDPEHVQHLFAESIEEIRGEGAATVDIGGRPFTVKRQFIQDLQEQEVDQTLSKLGRAVLLFHSPVDQVVGIENARLLYESLKHPKSYVSLDQADHLLSEPSDSRYVGAVLAAWARKYIGAPQEERKHPEVGHNVVVATLGEAHYRTEMLANGFSLVADEPVDVGGTNQGPTPYEYLLAALGACTVMTLRMYADHKEWPLEEASVRLEHSKIHAKDCKNCETKEGKVDRITRQLTVRGALSEEQRQRLLEIAGRCPVYRTLKGEITVESSLVPEESESG